MRISQRHIKEIFKARYVSFDLRKISVIGQTITNGQTKKTDRIFFLYLPKNVYTITILIITILIMFTLYLLCLLCYTLLYLLCLLCYTSLYLL